VEEVAELIRGFETPYGLELLTTTHWVAKEDRESIEDERVAIDRVHGWSNWKKRFKADHIATAWRRLREQGWFSNLTPIEPSY
jgi:hypothetical protein